MWGEQLSAAGFVPPVFVTLSRDARLCMGKFDLAATVGIWTWAGEGLIRIRSGAGDENATPSTNAGRQQVIEWLQLTNSPPFFPRPRYTLGWSASSGGTEIRRWPISCSCCNKRPFELLQH